jgi:5-formyltetrahydrofolate cyclo-ligase
MTDNAAWRRERRADLIARRSAMAEPVRAARSEAVERHLLSLLRSLPAGALAFYWPVRGEFDPRPAVRILLGDGWRAALPVIDLPKAPMSFRAWAPSSKMALGRHGIPIPAEGELVHPDAVLVPLVGFDGAKYRLGYGGGYFDRTLAVLDPRPVAIGVGFEFARLDSVRPHTLDLPMDRVVTEAGVM